MYTSLVIVVAKKVCPHKIFFEQIRFAFHYFNNHIVKIKYEVSNIQLKQMVLSFFPKTLVSAIVETVLDCNFKLAISIMTADVD